MFLYSTVSTLKPAREPALRRRRAERDGQQRPSLLTDGGDGCHNLTQLQLVQDCGFTSSIQPNLHQEDLSMLSEAACAATMKQLTRTMRILISFLAMRRASSLEMVRPMAFTLSLSY